MICESIFKVDLQVSDCIEMVYNFFISSLSESKLNYAILLISNKLFEIINLTFTILNLKVDPFPVSFL